MRSARSSCRRRSRARAARTLAAIRASISSGLTVRNLACSKPWRHSAKTDPSQHANVQAWLAKNPRITLNFTPTSGSWLNMVEIFFGIITRQAIRRGSFDSVKDLTTAIRRFIDGWNDRCQPFTWTKTADDIHDHVSPSQRTSFTRHQRLGLELGDRHVAQRRLDRSLDIVGGSRIYAAIWSYQRPTNGAIWVWRGVNCHLTPPSGG